MKYLIAIQITTLHNNSIGKIHPTIIHNPHYGTQELRTQTAVMETRKAKVSKQE